VGAERRVLAALLLRAAKDAESEDPVLATNCRRFLEGRGLNLAEMMGLDPDRIKTWLEGLPDLEEELAGCVYQPWQVAELLGISEGDVSKLKASGMLVPDVAGDRYSAAALLRFLWGEDEGDGDSGGA